MENDFEIKWEKFKDEYINTSDEQKSQFIRKGLGNRVKKARNTQYDSRKLYNQAGLGKQERFEKHFQMYPLPNDKSTTYSEVTIGQYESGRKDNPEYVCRFVEAVAAVFGVHPWIFADKIELEFPDNEASRAEKRKYNAKFSEKILEGWKRVEYNKTSTPKKQFPNDSDSTESYTKKEKTPAESYHTKQKQVSSSQKQKDKDDLKKIPSFQSLPPNLKEVVLYAMNLKNIITFILAPFAYLLTRAKTASATQLLGYGATGAAAGTWIAVQLLEVATPTHTFEGNQLRLFCETPNAAIHYTLDGGKPTQKSPKYTAPIIIEYSSALKAKAFIVTEDLLEKRPSSDILEEPLTVKNIKAILSEPQKQPTDQSTAQDIFFQQSNAKTAPFPPIVDDTLANPKKTNNTHPKKTSVASNNDLNKEQYVLKECQKIINAIKRNNNYQNPNAFLMHVLLGPSHDILKNAIEEYPNYPKTHQLKGFALTLYGGDYEAAKNSFLTALNLYTLLASKPIQPDIDREISRTLAGLSFALCSQYYYDLAIDAIDAALMQKHCVNRQNLEKAKNTIKHKKDNEIVGEGVRYTLKAVKSSNTFDKISDFRTALLSELIADSVQPLPEDIIVNSHHPEEPEEATQQLTESRPSTISIKETSPLPTETPKKNPTLKKSEDIESTLKFFYEKLSKNKGGYDHDLEYIESLLAKKPNNDELLVLRGLILDRSDKKDLALQTWENALKVNPNNVDAFNFAAARYLLKGNYKKAVEYFSKVISIDVTKKNAFVNRAQAYLQLNKLEKAFKDIENVLRLDPKNIEARRLRGMFFAKKGNFNKAIADFSAFLEINPTREGTLQNRGICYFKINNFSKAALDFDNLLKINPTNETALFYRRKISQKAKNTTILPKNNKPPKVRSIAMKIFVPELSYKTLTLNDFKRCYTDPNQYSINPIKKISILPGPGSRLGINGEIFPVQGMEIDVADLKLGSLSIGRGTYSYPPSDTKYSYSKKLPLDGSIYARWSSVREGVFLSSFDYFYFKIYNGSTWSNQATMEVEFINPEYMEEYERREERCPHNTPQSECPKSSAANGTLSPVLSQPTTLNETEPDKGKNNTTLTTPPNLTNGYWAVVGTDADIWNKSTLHFENVILDGKNYHVTGHFWWENNASTRYGKEIFKGTLYPDGTFSLDGQLIGKTIGIASSHYTGSLSEDGTHIINGTWGGQGVTTGQWSASQIPF